MLYAALVVAELFNIVQAFGFWFTCVKAWSSDRHRPLSRPPVRRRVHPGLRRTGRDRGGPRWPRRCACEEPNRAASRCFDDGGSPAMEALARRWGAAYVRRNRAPGVRKAGNINQRVWRRTSWDLCRGVSTAITLPHPSFLEAHSRPARGTGRRIGADFRSTTPTRGAKNDVAAAGLGAAGALSFGAIARGKRWPAAPCFCLRQRTWSFVETH